MLPLSSVEFVSVEFAFFFALFLPLYWLAAPAPRVQNVMLLLASFAWLVLLNVAFAAALAAYAFFVAFVGRMIDSERQAAFDRALVRARKNAGKGGILNMRAGRGWLIVGIAGALGNLALYKYADALGALLEVQGAGGWLLPLGLSYYTFQSITYLVALYKGNIRPWAWHEVPLYLAFFPTISSGPIWRADAMKSVAGVCPGAAGQLHIANTNENAPARRHMWHPALALVLIAWGAAKIWWLAGWMEATLLAPVFVEPAAFDATSVLVAIYGALVQLYLNFSGHADIAVGLAMLLGFRIPTNFAEPLLACNMRDFWARWHISLSTWIRDYVYIPLGGNRGSFARTQFNLLAAFALSGIWHGATWTFLLWGLAHGLALVLLNVVARVTGGWRLSALGWPGRMLAHAATLSFAAFTFLVFRCPTLDDIAAVLAALAPGSDWAPPPTALWGAAALLAGAACLPLLRRAPQRAARVLARLPAPLWCLPLAAVLFFLLIAAPAGVPGFIYAKF